MNYSLTCTEQCSFHSTKTWSLQCSDLLFGGKSLRYVVAEAKRSGIITNVAALSRHKRHIVAREVESEDDGLGTKATNIQILEEIIQKGFGNRKNWKPTIGDTMKALDMHFKLTQGNPFDELLNTLAEAGSLAEAPEASLAKGERPDPGEEDPE